MRTIVIITAMVAVIGIGAGKRHTDYCNDVYNAAVTECTPARTQCLNNGTDPVKCNARYLNCINDDLDAAGCGRIGPILPPGE